MAFVMNEDVNLLQNEQVKTEKLKLGEIFQLRDDSISINCIHCLLEFQYFSEFTLHIEEHYLSGQIQRLKKLSMSSPDATTEMLMKEEPPVDIQLESDETNDEDDYRDDHSESLNDDQDNSRAMEIEDAKDCDSTLPSEYKTVELTPSEQKVQTNDMVSLPLVHSVNGVPSKKAENNLCRKDESNVSSHGKNGMFECLVCQLQYSRKMSYLQHVRNKHKTKRYPCSLCSELLPNNCYLKNHMRSVHGVKDCPSIKPTVLDSESKFECSICKGLYETIESLANHIRETHEPKRFSCSLCSREFARRVDLRTHLKKKHGIMQRESIAQNTNKEKKVSFHPTGKKFECSYCQKKYISKRTLRQHMEFNHLSKQFSCSSCLESFTRRIYAQKHIKTVHGVSDSKSIEDILMDMQSAQIPMPYRCPLCNKRFLQSENARTHIKALHGISEFSIKDIKITQNNPGTGENVFAEYLGSEFECFDCHRPFASFNTLKFHYRNAHKIQRKVKPFSCPLCLSRSTRLTNVQTHIKKTHGVFYTAKAIMAAQTKSEELNQKLLKSQIPMPYRCPLCNKRCLQSGNARAHIKVMHGISEFSIEDIKVTQNNSETGENVFAKYLGSEFECFDCRRPFASFNTLKFHYRNAHKTQRKVKPFSCPLCLSRSTRLTNVRKHIKETHGVFYTAKAIMAAQTKSEELNQILLEHRNEDRKRLNGKWICDICGLEFTQKGGLKLHQNSHKGRKNFKCEICNKTLSIQYGSEHMQIHTGEKNQECTICGKRFLNKKRLGNHEREQHDDTPNFKCDICDETFTWHYKMVKHRRWHPEEMPHVCKTCNRGFMTWDSLRKHRLRHERDENAAKSSSN